MAEPNDSNTSDSQFVETLNRLRELLTSQLQDLQQLTDIKDAVIKEQQLSKDVEFLKGYEDQIVLITKQQQSRFGTIDHIMDEHVLAVKKGRDSDEQIIVFGKEVRKMEAGIRTVKLFLSDVINMLSPEQKLVNRIDDRIQYFNKRSTELKNEIAFLQAK